MKTDSNDKSSNELKFYVEDRIAVISNDSNAFATLTQFDYIDKLLNFYDKIANSPDIDGLLIINQIGGFSESAYVKFLESIEQKEQHKKDILFAVEINMLRRFILKIINLEKIVVFGLDGNVITPFIGLSLAGDFRFASENLVLNFNHIKYGSHPTGGIPYFLPNYISRSRANDLMFNGGMLSAKSALDLGLVNKVFSNDNFFENCFNATKALCSTDKAIISRTKRLIKSAMSDIESYFKIETSLTGAG